MTEKNDNDWKIIGESIRGASHINNDIPNQDAIVYEDIEGLGIFLAVADGHGSEKCFRSDIGSKIAVDTILHIVKETDFTDLENVKELLIEYIPKETIKTWRNNVLKHIEDNPFNNDQNDLFIPYGSTLLAILCLEKHIICWQLGDGDILQVDNQGKVTRVIEKDESLIANQTTSLCTNNAYDNFNISIFKNEEHISMVMLATDGYRNSFKHEEGFIKVASDYFEILQEEGIDFVNENINDWLNETSMYGSGDDISIGIVYKDNYSNLHKI